MSKLLLLSLFLLTVLQGEVLDVYLGTGADGIYKAIFNQKTGEISKAQKIYTVKSPNFLERRGGILFAATREHGKDGGVASYKILEDGSLAQISSQPTMGAGSCHVNLDAGSGILMAVNYSGGSVVSYLVQRGGELTDLCSIFHNVGSSINSHRQNHSHPHSIYPGPDGVYAYVPDLGTDEILIFKVLAGSGKIQKVGSVKHPAGGGPRHMRFSANGRFAYVLSELTLETVVYERDAPTGMLSLSQRVSNIPNGDDKSEMTCSEIIVSKEGEYVYAANRDLTEQGRDSVSVFKASPTGDLALMQTVAAGVWVPQHIQMSPNEEWLLIAGQKSNEVVVLKRSLTDGTLSGTDHSVAVPRVMCVEF